MARPQSELTKFLLSLPTSLSTAEVVAKAKQRGMKTSESNVNRVRQMARSGPGRKPARVPAKQVASPKPPKSTPHAGDAKEPSKSDFVRSFPPSTPANDIIAAARKKGMSLSVGYVYNLRTAENARAGKSKRSGPSRSATTSPRPSSSGGQARETQRTEASRATTGAAPEQPIARETVTGSSETAFRSTALALILERGISAATAVLDQISTKLRSAAT
jgi:hypothetical protein